MGLDLKQLCFAVPHRLYANNTPLLIAFLHMIFTPIICEDNAHTTQNLSSKKLQTAMDKHSTSWPIHKVLFSLRAQKLSLVTNPVA